MLKYIELTMIRNDTKNIPQFELPEGFSIRHFRESDLQLWADIETAAGEFKTTDEALQQLQTEFIPYIKEFEQRSLFLLNKQGTGIGTGTAWYNKRFRDEEYGRVHWIGIHPEYQGQNLAKPLVSAVIDILRQRHAKLYLTTQTTSYKAVKVYLDFGFIPLIEGDDDREGWEMLLSVLHYPRLRMFL